MFRKEFFVFTVPLNIKHKDLLVNHFSNILITYSPPFVSPGEPLASSPEEPLPPPLARDRVLCSSTVCAA